MADNYLENKYEQMLQRREKEKRAKQLAWKKRMDAYRKRLAEQEKESSDSKVLSPDDDEVLPEGRQ